MAGMMNNIRERAGGVMVGVLVVAFGGLWALQDSGAFDNVGRGPDARIIGRVDGEIIEGELFQRAVDQQLDAYQAQGLEVTGSLQRQIESQVFDSFVDNAIVEREMDRFGVEVTDDEVFALITGDDPDPLIAQVFPDGNGGVDRAALQQVVEDPQFGEQLQAIEEQVRRNRRQAKLAALVTATARVTPGEVEAEFIRQNRQATAQFVALRYADVPDDQVEVTDRDLQTYYRDNESDYDRPESYTLEYVAFDKTPTADDSTRATDELEGFIEGFRSAPNAVSYARRNSFGAAVDPEFVGAGNLPAELATAVFANLEEGNVVGPVVAGDQAILARVMGVRDGDETSLKARHILLPEGAEEVAEQLKRRIEAGAISFEDAARQQSMDESNKARGGDLGWFSRGRMVSEFEDAAFSAPIGQVVGPVESQFGQHLILVEARSSQEVELVQISRPVEADFARVVEQAQDFQAFIELEGRDFTEEAQERGIAPTEIQVTEDGQLPGLDVGRDFFRFLARSSEGRVSEPLDAGTSFIVARLIERNEAGPAPFAEVENQVRSAVMLERKREVQTAALEAALESAGSLSALASAVGTEVVEASELLMSRPVLPGFGLEPTAVGAAFGLRPGQRSGVIEGDQSAFVVRTTALRGATPGELTAEVRESLEAELLQRKRQRVLQAWLAGLREEVDIEDYRTDLL
ncbi:peptidyl-prolyl cis-trans isomerase [Rubrivirga sp.]|uniref:peptidyl-prolyl cis-trans isomerase n=1 Tax=Rubrivirga sp. TaxID=1885344 RepID=UPI003C77EB5D